MNLDYLVLGAILVKPSIAQEVYGFGDADLDAALLDLKQGNKERLKSWFRSKGIFGEEILGAVIRDHERRVIEERISVVCKKIQTAGSLKAVSSMERLNVELKGLLERHETNTSQKKNSAAATDATQADSGTQQGQRSQSDSSQEKREESWTEGKPVGTGSVQGGESGMRVQGVDRPTGRSLSTTRPAPYRSNPMGQE